MALCCCTMQDSHHILFRVVFIALKCINFVYNYSCVWFPFSNTHKRQNDWVLKRVCLCCISKSQFSFNGTESYGWTGWYFYTFLHVIHFTT